MDRHLTAYLLSAVVLCLALLALVEHAAARVVIGLALFTAATILGMAMEAAARADREE